MPWTKENDDILGLLLHPHASLKDFVNARREWHGLEVDRGSQLSISRLEIEAHNFYMMCLLKLIVTKGNAGKVEANQLKENCGIAREV